MELRRIIRTDIAASALAHASLVAFVILISEVHPFHAAPTQSVAIDIVTPDEVKEAAPEPPPAPQSPAVQLPTPPPPVPESAMMAKADAPDAPPPPSSAPPSQPASQTPSTVSPPAPPVVPPQSQPSPPPRQREANAQPQVQQPSPAPSFLPPEPDVTVKYGVRLGLPEQLQPSPKVADKAGDKDSDGGDANASTAADLRSSIVAAFRHQLRKCSKLPASIAPSDNVMIKLRAVLTTDGRLATDPILIEASASAKGPILMQSAKSALMACQPYDMLPADRYGEWKVMDLTFTPHDFDAS